MKKLLLILLCLPMIFSCGGNLDKEITEEMMFDGYKGKGTFIFNGDKYVGEWRDGKMHGQGTYTFADGGKFVGEFKDGYWNGQGTYTYSSGNKYVGEWKDDKMHGEGTYTTANGGKFVGKFKDGWIWKVYSNRSYMGISI